MPLYAKVLLPLAAPGEYTYALPPELAGRVTTGSRVVVSFGPRRHYTAVVTEVGNEPPPEGVEEKSVEGLADAAPIVLPAQLALWKWIASYYMCTPGEVMKAALPAGLKLESETVIARDENFDVTAADLTPKEAALLAALPKGKAARVADIEKTLRSRTTLHTVQSLMDKGAVSVSESMLRGYRPRTETHVRLTPALDSEAAVNATLDSLKKTHAEAQERLLLRYLDLSQAAAALTLRNPALLLEVAKADLADGCEGADGALTALRRKGILETYLFAVERIRPQAASTLPPRELDSEQARALAAIKEAFAQKDVCLLHGVTSSGKTEVYTHLIAETLAAGRQALYLVPEIALTTQLTTRLSRVFGGKMGVYHSKFPDAERAELWKRQLTAEAFPLVLGARSALFLPFRDLGLIVVDEEHETSYKQQEPAPRYHARDTALVLARMTGAKVLLGSATPSLESYHNAMRGKYGLVEMAKRHGGVMLPEIVVEDVKELRRKKLMKTPFSPRLTEEVRAALAAGGQAILFLNRRGYAPVIECRACGWTPRCTKCDVSLTYHRRMGKLVCHYCGAAYDVPEKCPCCEGTELRDMGCGTEKIEEAAREVFPEARTARMDLDTTRSRTAYEKIIDDFQHGRTNLLIGTQMVTKGLDFDRVRVVGVINADQMLNAADFRAHERAYQMMSQVAGRAGRRGRRGLVVVQTRQPDTPVIAQTVAGDYRAMYAEQMEERADFRYAPLLRMIDIYVKHRDERRAEGAAQALAAMLSPHFGADLLGPDCPAVSRVQSLHIRKLVLKVAPALPPAGVRRTLLAARDALLAQEGYKSVTVYFDADPL